MGAIKARRILGSFLGMEKRGLATWRRMPDRNPRIALSPDEQVIWTPTLTGIAAARTISGKRRITR